jgi:hypothetical protein
LIVGEAKYRYTLLKFGGENFSLRIRFVTGMLLAPLGEFVGLGFAAFTPAVISTANPLPSK